MCIKLEVADVPRTYGKLGQSVHTNFYIADNGRTSVGPTFCKWTDRIPSTDPADTRDP